MKTLVTKNRIGGFALYMSVSQNVVVRYSNAPDSGSVLAHIYDKYIYIDKKLMSLVIRDGCMNVVGVDLYE